MTAYFAEDIKHLIRDVIIGPKLPRGSRDVKSLGLCPSKLRLVTEISISTGPSQSEQTKSDHQICFAFRAQAVTNIQESVTMLAPPINLPKWYDSF